MPFPMHFIVCNDGITRKRTMKTTHNELFRNEGVKIDEDRVRSESEENLYERID